MIGIGSIPVFAMIIVDPDSVMKYMPKIFNFDFIFNLDKKELAFFGAVVLLIIYFLKNLFLCFVNYFQANIIRKLKINILFNLFFSYNIL